MTDTTEPIDALAYPPAQAAKVTGRSHTRIKKAIREKELTARKDGRATLIEHAELQRWLASLPTIGRTPGGLIPEIRNPAARFPWRDRRAHRALQKAYSMQTDSKTGSQLQGLPLFDWRAVVVRKPETRAGQYLYRRLPIPPGHADLIAALAGLGSAVD